MTQTTAITTIDKELIQSLILEGDLSKMNDTQKTQYYGKLCESLGLNPFTRPFQLLKLSGKLVMYATKDCTEQLRKIHGVSITDVVAAKVENIYIVTAKATDKDGRSDAATGAVNIEGKNGDDLANALMKAETKAKRRVTLSICGLGMLDETEIETIPGVIKVEEKITDSQLALIEGLIHSSTVEEAQKEKIEAGMFQYSQERAEKCIVFLRENQKETLNEQFETALKRDEK